MLDMLDLAEQPFSSLQHVPTTLSSSASARAAAAGAAAAELVAECSAAQQPGARHSAMSSSGGSTVPPATPDSSSDKDCELSEKESDGEERLSRCAGRVVECKAELAMNESGMHQQGLGATMQASTRPISPPPPPPPPPPPQP